MIIVNKTMMPNGKILKPSRPLTVPNYMMHVYDEKQEINGVTEYETWSLIGSQKFGIILINSESPSNQSLQIKNYNFYNIEQKWNTAIVFHGNGKKTISHHQWNVDKSLDFLVPKGVSVSSN